MSENSLFVPLVICYIFERKEPGTGVEIGHNNISVSLSTWHTTIFNTNITGSLITGNLVCYIVILTKPSQD